MDDTTWRPGENQHQVGQKFLKFAMWSAAGDGMEGLGNCRFSGQLA